MFRLRFGKYSRKSRDVEFDESDDSSGVEERVRYRYCRKEGSSRFGS